MFESTSTGIKYRVGTLEYTKRSLMVMFLWLLWGDFCFTLMTTVEPSVVPFVLKSLKASDLVISLYITTFTNILNLTVCPISSFMSDRYRSKWGRRVPFLAFATPFVGIFLILTGYCREISSYLFKNVFHHSIGSETALAIGIVGVFVVGYQFFNMIVSSVYYYLFNDVVPEQYLGRFMAIFRAVGTAAGALYNFFVFPYAQSHSKWILVGFGLLYFVGFMMMCLKVKEGEYPPPPVKDDGKNAALEGVKTFFTESFSHKFYLYFYLSSAFWGAAGVVGPFMVFRNLEMGVTMKEMGFIGGVVMVVATLLLIPAGYFVDKKHPLRLGLMAIILYMILIPLNIVYLWNWSHGVLLSFVVIINCLTLPISVVLMAAELPMFMRLLPHSRYGQFCSANSVVVSLMQIVAGVLCGLFLNGLKWFCHDKLHTSGDYYYRLLFIWPAIFGFAALYYRLKLYKMWLKLGGDDNYVPPVFEEEEAALKAYQADKIASPSASDR